MKNILIESSGAKKKKKVFSLRKRIHRRKSFNNKDILNMKVVKNFIEIVPQGHSLNYTGIQI
jgi:hypothetical protein